MTSINFYTFLKYLLVMSGVTYLVRVVPFLMFRNKIENRFVRTFLDYIPYAVLAAMTVPAIFYSTTSVAAAIAGFIVAVLLAYAQKSLIIVALLSSAGVFVVLFIQGLFR